MELLWCRNQGWYALRLERATRSHVDAFKLTTQRLVIGCGIPSHPNETSDIKLRAVA
jgi:hypothetical protein